MIKYKKICLVSKGDKIKMFAYVSGILMNKNNNNVIVEAGGIGYSIFMPVNSIKKLPEIGEKVKIHTYYYVREDNISLYGFNSIEELRMFELLLSVSGIGAKSALAMISELSPSQFALDVISSDVSDLVKIPGIGNKTAQRIILELKDKLKTESAIIKAEVSKEGNKIEVNNVLEEAVAALQVLGYQQKEIQNALSKMNVQELNVEDIIRKALILLSK